MTVSFKCSKRDLLWIRNILARAEKLKLVIDRQTHVMDLMACHANGCKLDFERFYKMPDFDFAHDFTGIYRHMDRNTGKLGNCFLPRASRKPGKRAK